MLFIITGRKFYDIDLRRAIFRLQAYLYIYTTF